MRCLAHLLGIGHVHGQRQHRVAELFFQVGDISEVASGRGDLIAAFQRGFDPDAAEPARSSGDEPCFLHVAPFNFYSAYVTGQ